MKLFILINQKTRAFLRLCHYLIFKAIYPPGHYYSPIVSRKNIIKREKQIFPIPENKLDSIDLDEKEQIGLLEQLHGYYKEIPFEAHKKNNLRYYFVNSFYSYSDAIFLYNMIRHFQPKRIIEIGSGFSSAVMLDTNQLFMNNLVELIFIEPDPNRLFSLLSQEDKKRHKVILDEVQDIDLGLFSQLKENDILFIDSSHVCKTGSDVNYIFFNIFPRLKKGVLIHFHDIFYPFEYSLKWAMEGRSWNETYLLRAFLTHNKAYKIVLMNTFMQLFHKHWFEENMPLCLKHTGGSIWIRKMQNEG